MIFPWENAIFHKIAIVKENAKKHRKMFQKSSKIEPKSFENRAKIDQKPRKIDKKCLDDLRCEKNAIKLRKNAKNDPTWPQEPPKGRDFIFPAGLRVALPGLLNNHSK